MKYIKGKLYAALSITVSSFGAILLAEGKTCRPAYAIATDITAPLVAVSLISENKQTEPFNITFHRHLGGSCNIVLKSGDSGVFVFPKTRIKKIEIQQGETPMSSETFSHLETTRCPPIFIDIKITKSGKAEVTHSIRGSMSNACLSDRAEKLAASWFGGPAMISSGASVYSKKFDHYISYNDLEKIIEGGDSAYKQYLEEKAAALKQKRMQKHAE